MILTRRDKLSFRTRLYGYYSPLFKFNGAAGMRSDSLGIALLFMLLAGCGASEQSDQGTAGPVDLAKQNIIVDTHIDVPYRLENEPADVSQALDSGDFDYPRALAGGLNAAFMSIYTPADLALEGKSFATAEVLIDKVEAIVAKSPDKFAIALSPHDVRAQFDAGLISLPMGMENGSPIEGSLDKLRHFHARGIRYITLAHSKSNLIADSSYDDNRQWNGLSDFGVDVVREMNRLGIMVDVSHLSDDAFWQVLDISTAPVIASHSSARHFTPGFERNMSDEMIEALAKNGGVIMINYGSSFITEQANVYSSARWDAEDVWRAEKPELSDSQVSEQFNAIWAEEHGPFPYADISDVLDHIDHVVALVGVGHVGIGSDYDGVGDSLPAGLKDVSSYPNLVEGLLARGYSTDDTRKILGENLLRVWAAVEENAAAAD